MCVLQGLCSNGKLPMGALSQGNEAIRDAICSENPVTFFEAKEADAENEKMPEASRRLYFILVHRVGSVLSQP